MNEPLEIHVSINGKTNLVGHFRYIAKVHRQSSVFEYSKFWLINPLAFALDPVNLPLTTSQHYWTSEKTALPGSIRDCAPDRWGRQLVRRAFQKIGESRNLSELDYLLAINDFTRIGALRFRRDGETDFDHCIGQRTVPPLVSLPALLNAAIAIQTNTESAEDLDFS